ncbi:MAG: response regulator transcription factor [Oscillospiraceae bacterium]|jgi:two-component system alkaline phosphatase synthesis response regulator PhoP|nr:response regulator transcription factor [Oscillospiraceae bacterium]
MIRILVVEDEKPISDLLDMSLTSAGYTCDCVFTGIEAADAVNSRRYDLILLDVMLPGIDGFELMEYLAPMEIPVIFITARSAVKDRIKGLKLGADDYITKPFEIAELLARVETVLRRYHKTESRITVGDVVVDTQSRVVTRGGEPVQLTAKEYNLLILFLQNKNIALFRETIYERVWENDYMGDSRTVDLHVQRLRKKLGWQERIAAVYKVGYRLEVHDE